MSHPSGRAVWSMPDLYLIVSREFDDGEPVLDFQLHGTALSVPMEEMGKTPLGSGYLDAVNDLQAQWEAACREKDTCPGRAMDNQILARKGEYLFEILLPERLQRRLWQMRGRARTLIVESSEPIPWELLRLQDPDSDETDHFLCMVFQLARWLPTENTQTTMAGNRRMPAMGFKMSPMALIRGEGDAAWMDEELNALSGAHAAWKPERIPSSWDGVQEALASGRYRAWHFVGHGHYDAETGREVALRLESYEDLKPEILAGPCRAAGKKRPLVFWNCCYSSRAVQLFGGIRGWAEVFMKHGFGAFIGTLWAVETSAAHTFAGVFYRELAEGDTLGEAMQAARLAVKAEGSGDWQAYVLYGDPRARMLTESGALPSVEALWAQTQASPFKAAHLSLLETLAVAAEPLPPFALAAFAGVSEDTLASFRDVWDPHVHWSDDQRAYPRSTLRAALSGWVRDGRLSTDAAHRRIVAVLMREVHGVPPERWQKTHGA